MRQLCVDIDTAGQNSFGIGLAEFVDPSEKLRLICSTQSALAPFRTLCREMQGVTLGEHAMAH
jgi:hypothetical protein